MSKPDTLRLSWSSMSAYMHCQRRYDLEYNQGLMAPIGEDSYARLLGSYVHAAFEGALWAHFLGTAPELRDLQFNAANRLRAYVQETRIENKQVYSDEVQDFVRDDAYYSMLEDLWVQARDVVEYQIWKFDWNRYEVMTLGTLYPDTESQMRYLTWSENMGGLNEPLIEWKLAVPIEQNPQRVVISGVVDAVLYDKELGEPVILDFKTRASMSAPETVQLDGQLPLYAALLNWEGEVVTRALQYQMANAAPKPAQLTPSTGKISGANIKTTWEVWSNSVKAMGQDPEEYREKMMPKMNPPEDFTFPVDIPVGGEADQRTVENLRDIVEAIQNAKNFPAILSTAMHGCSFCSFKQLCSAYQMGGDVSDMVRTKFLVKSKFWETGVDAL